MGALQIYKPTILKLFFSLNLLLLANLTSAQFQIVGMQYNGPSGWVTATQAHLTISEPGKQPYTQNVQYDYAKQYASGTTFTTHENTSISIMYKGQTQVMYPNSTLKVVIESNGIKAQTLKGTVNHILKDVKQKVGFYKAGNGYTWAHAEGTQFIVQASGQSKNVKIQTSEGRVTIVDQVPVVINQSATTKIGGKAGAELNTTVRTTNSAGQQAYVTNQGSNKIQYQTYGEAIEAFEKEIRYKEQSGNAYIEELAENYSLIGELYMEIGEFDRAIEPLGKAVEYLSALDDEDLYIIDTSLFYSEALINSSISDNRTIGNNLVIQIINILTPVLNEYIAEYNFANEDGDEDWAWDLCYDLVDINEYLGWSYELLNNDAKANEFYNWADTYEERL